MATRQMSYDHPAYTAVMFQDMRLATGALLTGNAASTTKYTAFTNMLLKSLTLSPTTVGSGADPTLLLYKITNNGTTAVNTATITYTLGTATPTSLVPINYAMAAITTSAISTSGTLGTNAAAVVGCAGVGIPLIQGDTFYLTKGTDASVVYGVTAELGVAPFANVTVG